MGFRNKQIGTTPDNKQANAPLGFWAALRKVWSKSPIQNAIVSIGISYFIGLGCYIYFVDGGKLRAHHRYAIGYVYKTHWTVKSGKFADYRFTVNGTTYTGSDKALADMRLQGGRYVVEFHPPDPDIKVIYYRAPVPDSVTEAPAEGWQTPPFAVPKEVLE